MLVIVGNVLREENGMQKEEIEKLTTSVKGREDYLLLTKFVDEKTEPEIAT